MPRSSCSECRGKPPKNKAIEVHASIGGLCQSRNHGNAIRELARLICGVALASNRQYMLARSTAWLVISMFGELFDDTSETKLLLKLPTYAVPSWAAMLKVGG